MCWRSRFLFQTLVLAIIVAEILEDTIANQTKTNCPKEMFESLRTILLMPEKRSCRIEMWKFCVGFCNKKRNGSKPFPDEVVKDLNATCK